MPDLPLFLLALVIAYVVPGPDMVFMIQTGAGRSWRRTIASAAGLAVARALHVTLSAAGLAAVIATSPTAYAAVRWAGAAYLAWLGWKIIRAPSLSVGAETTVSRRETASAGFLRGFATNALNPKALVFCSVLLPQFVHPGTDGVDRFLLLGTILVATGFAFDLTFGAAGGAIGRTIGRHRLIETAQRWVFGTVLIGFGVRLAAG